MDTHDAVPGDTDALDASAKLVLALRMMEEGIELARQKLAREHPSDTEAQLEARLLAWKLSRE